LKRQSIRWPILAGGALTALAAIGAIVMNTHGSSTEPPLKPNSANYVAGPERVEKRSASKIARPDTVDKPAIRDVARSGKSDKPAASSDHSADGAYYSHAIRDNLFSAPVPEPAPEPALKPARVTVKVPQAPPPPDPLADAVYAGSVTENGKTAALIQSRSTNVGKYVVPGSRWEGFTVSSVSPKEIELTHNGAHRTLELSDTINVVQLSASAPQPVTPAAPTGAIASPQLPGANAAAAAAAQSALMAQRFEQRRLQRQQRNEQRAMRSMYQQFRGGRGQYFGR